MAVAGDDIVCPREEEHTTDHKGSTSYARPPRRVQSACMATVRLQAATQQRSRPGSGAGPHWRSWSARWPTRSGLPGITARGVEPVRPIRTLGMAQTCHAAPLSRQARQRRPRRPAAPMSLWRARRQVREAVLQDLIHVASEKKHRLGRDRRLAAAPSYQRSMVSPHVPGRAVGRSHAGRQGDDHSARGVAERPRRRTPRRQARASPRPAADRRRLPQHRAGVAL